MARPKIKDSEQHTDRFAVYLTDKDGDLLRSLATKKGMAPGVLARVFLMSKLDQLTVLINDGESLSNSKRH